MARVPILAFGLLLCARHARGDEVTATAVSETGEVLYATTDGAGNAGLVIVDPDTLDSWEEALGPGLVTDLECTEPHGDVAAFEDGGVLALGGWDWMDAPFGELHSASYADGASAFGNSNELALCDGDGAGCTSYEMTAPVTEVTIIPPPPEDTNTTIVVSDGEVQFFSGTTFVARLTTEIGVPIQLFKVIGDSVGIGVGPCMIVGPDDADTGMLIEGADARFVTFADLGKKVDAAARARQGIILGTWFDSQFAGELVLDASGRIVELDTMEIVAEFDGVSVFPTALSDFDLGPPLSGVALGGSAAWIDQDGAGPSPPTLVFGSLVHFADPGIAADACIRRAKPGKTRHGRLTARLEIPGAFVEDVDLDTVSLSGVSVDRAGRVADRDLDGEPDRPLRFRRQDLLDALPDGVSSVLLTGSLDDGVPFAGAAVIEVVPHTESCE
jgi:hypothetical protein